MIFVRCVLLTLLMQFAVQAQAGNTIAFNGGNVSACTRSGSSYSCASLPYVNYDDSIIISSGFSVTVSSAVTIGYNQGLTMSGTASLTANGNLDISGINPSILSITGGSLAANGGTFSMGAQAQTITANISGTTINIGTGSTTKITGSLTATGTVTLASHATVVGPIVAASVSTGSPTTINGNVTVTNDFTLASGSSMTGNLSAATASIQASGVTLTGNVTATTSLTVASGDTIAGDVTAGNVVMQDSSAFITGNASVTAITLGYADRVQKTITCKPPGSGCSCVTNNSGYAYTGAAPGPVCATASAVPTLDHIQITQPGSALTCQPQTVTVTACANATCSSLYTGSVTVTLSPGAKSFAIGASGVNSAATVQQSTVGTTAVAVSSSTPAASTTATSCINSSSGSSAASTGAACNMTFYDTGLTVNVPDNISATNTTFTLQALQKGPTSATAANSCVPLFTNSTKSVNLSCAYSNPATGTIALLINGQSTACTGTGGQTVPVYFNASGLSAASGSTPAPYLNYADVGQLTLNAKYVPGTGDDTNLGATGSDNFIVSPASFGVVATPPAFAGATLPFVVKALNAAGAVTPNFGNESTAESASIKETFVSPNFSTAPIQTDPGLTGNFGSTGNLGDFKGNLGIATNSGAVWDQVGVITLTATLANTAGYLASGNVTKGASNITVIPHHFTTVVPTGAAVPMSCDPTKQSNCPSALPFVYSGEPFPLTINAVDKAGNLMSNYDGVRTADTSAARPVTLSAWDAAGSTKTQNPPGGATAGALTLAKSSATTVAAAAFSGGMAVLSPAKAAPNAPLAYTLSPALNAATMTIATAGAAPATIYLRAADAAVGSVPSDGATSQAAGQAYEQGLMVFSGRMLVSNGYGSEVLPMPVSLQAQLYGANGTWIPSVYDSGSSFINTDIVIGNCIPKVKGAACTAPTAMVSGSAPVLFSAGKSSFRLAAPGNSLSVDVTLNGTNPATWTIPYLPSITAREVFGIYKSGPILYQREVY